MGDLFKRVSVNQNKQLKLISALICIVCAHMPVFLTPHLNILVGSVDFMKRVHAVHKFIVNIVT